MSESFLSSFHAPDEWTHQVHPGANHALWFAGHMGCIDNMFIGIVDPSQARAVPGYWERFGMGSTPTDRPEDYPPVDEVLAYMRERRAVFLRILDGLSEEDLARATPPGSPKFLPDVTSIFEGAVWHEGMHAGQLSVARRAPG